MNDYQFFERRKFAAPHLIVLPRDEHFLVGHSYMGKWSFVTAATREVFPEVLAAVYFKHLHERALSLEEAYAAADRHRTGQAILASLSLDIDL